MIKFGQKQTMRDKVAVVDSRYGKTTGSSKGSKPAPGAKVKPVIKKNTVGFKVTKKF